MIEEIKRAIENTGAQSVIIFKSGGVHVVSRWGAGGYSYAQFQEWVIKNQQAPAPAASQTGQTGPTEQAAAVENAS